MPFTRREFIRGAAVASAAALLPTYQLQRTHAAPANIVEQYLQAMETPYAAPLNLHFERVIGSNKISLLLYDVKNASLLTALAPEDRLPVASAFKAPLVMYFLDQIPEDVWANVPVEHWNAVSANDLPERARPHWQQHNAILRALHQSTVFSDNYATGEVLSYVAQHNGAENAVVAFNEWAQQTVGISQLSGLSAWGDGITGDLAYSDERYAGSGTTINGQIVTFENLMTARDLGLFYMWMLTSMSADQQRACKALLSTIHNNRGANLERLALAHDGMPYSKNGSLDTEAGYVVTDAGLIALPDDRLLMLVVLSLGAPTVVPTLFEELSLTLGGKYNEALHNRHTRVVSNEELLEAYRAHLEVAYPQQGLRNSGAFRYGFIMPAGVKVYSSPNEADEIHNPIIKSTRFGIHLLMQGALARYAPVNRRWVELMPDNDMDNVRSRLGTRVFVKRQDVWEISLGHAQPIPYLVEPDATSVDKFIVIHLQARELYAFEGTIPVLHVPIVLNLDFTPRGAQIITSKWFARSMQPWAPGVPFTGFYGSEGYALHGSPWQRWSTTVNQSNISGRSSAGCVNIPDWMVTTGEYNRPADELLFRWLGGIENPREAVFEYPTETYPAVRIFNVDYLDNLRRHPRPQGLVNRGHTWDDVIDQMSTLPLQAPDSFFL